VRGVLPHEWFPSWDGRALDMGALCVRTFAAFWVAAGGKYDCADLDDTTASQVYTDGTDPRTDAAVERTRGEVIVRDGSLVSTEYSAENGTPTKFGAVDPHCAGKTVNGHRRGTCQWGTQRWATLEGKDRFWMAGHYYPGATVRGPEAPGPTMAAAIVEAHAPATLEAGARGQVTVEVENTGTAAWDGGVLIGTRAPSRLVEPGSWLAADRVTAVGPVEPGGVARLTFAIVAPSLTAAEELAERFEVVADGDPPVWLAGEGGDVRIRIVPAGAGGPGPESEGEVDLGDPTGGCRTGRGPGVAGLALWVLGLLGAAGAARRRRTPRR
jgi:hypothetical protein